MTTDVVNKFRSCGRSPPKKVAPTGCTLCARRVRITKSEPRKDFLNGTITIANGIRAYRVDGIIDHMVYETHKAVSHKKKMDEAWGRCNKWHQLLRLLTSNYKSVFEMLVRMVVDVHNDCLVETVSARS